MRRGESGRGRGERRAEERKVRASAGSAGEDYAATTDGGGNGGGGDSGELGVRDGGDGVWRTAVRGGWWAAMGAGAGAPTPRLRFSSVFWRSCRRQQ